MSTTMEKLGYDQARSKVRIKLKNGKMLTGRADIARGHPQKPMTWAELSDKFRDCAALVLPRANAEATIKMVSALPKLRSLSPLLRALTSVKTGAQKIQRRRSGSKQWSHTRKR
jgi:2-methylcitrate dehydratase PrpD